MKYRVELDYEYGNHIVTEEPNYDGATTNINDDINVYHVDATTPEEAIEIAKFEDCI